MGHHILDKGKELISAIIEIGKVLGYVAKKEFPIDKIVLGNFNQNTEDFLAEKQVISIMKPYQS